MNRSKKSLSLFTLIIPLVGSILVVCVTAGYAIYRMTSNRAYRERWEEYNECGLA